MASVPLSVSNFDAFLKEIYPSVRVQAHAKRKRPLLEWMPMADEFYGDTYVVPVLLEDPQGRSAALSTAITNAETTKQQKFVITARQKDYGVVEIEGEAIMAASKDVGSFIRAKDPQIKGMLRNLGKSLHIALYRSGSGSIGQMNGAALTDTDTTDDTFVLSNPSDANNFGVGQTIVANTTDDSVTMLKAVKVTAVDRQAGKIVTDTDLDTGGSTWGLSDFLFTEGDADAKVSGLAAWLPLTAPTSTAFHGLDRTSDIEGLGGWRIDNTGRSILENGEELGMLIGEAGGDPTDWFMNPRAGQQLAAEVGAKVTRHEGGKANAGFSGFVLETFVSGPVNVRFDIGCPVDRAYLLQRDTWKFAHMGGVPHIIRDDGKESQRGSTTDDIQVRGRYFGELACFSPLRNGVMSVATS